MEPRIRTFVAMLTARLSKEGIGPFAVIDKEGGSTGGARVNIDNGAFSFGQESDVDVTSGSDGFLVQLFSSGIVGQSRRGPDLEYDRIRIDNPYSTLSAVDGICEALVDRTHSLRGGRDGSGKAPEFPVVLVPATARKVASILSSFAADAIDELPRLDPEKAAGIARDILEIRDVLVASNIGGDDMQGLENVVEELRAYVEPASAGMRI